MNAASILVFCLGLPAIVVAISFIAQPEQASLEGAIGAVFTWNLGWASLIGFLFLLDYLEAKLKNHS